MLIYRILCALANKKGRPPSRSRPFCQKIAALFGEDAAADLLERADQHQLADALHLALVAADGLAHLAPGPRAFVTEPDFAAVDPLPKTAAAAAVFLVWFDLAPDGMRDRFATQ